MPQTEWHKATKEELLKTLRGFGITPNPAELKGNMVFQILDEETRRHEASKKVYNNLNDPTGQMRIHQARHDKIFYAGERGVLGQYDVRSLAFQWYHDGRSLNHKTHCRELKSAAYDGFETYENNMRLHQQDPENNPEPDAPFFDKYTEGSTNGVELERGRLGPALKGKSKARKAVDEDHEDEKRAQVRLDFSWKSPVLIFSFRRKQDFTRICVGEPRERRLSADHVWALLSQTKKTRILHK